MRPDFSRRLASGFRVTSLGTLAGRMLGLLRDLFTAAILGMSAGGLMDAFFVAFRIPELIRRLLAEGALTASYVPAAAQLAAKDRTAARQLAGATLLALLLFAGSALIVAELSLWGIWRDASASPDDVRLAQLTALLLPYAFLLCITAHLAGTLYAVGNFTAPAMISPLLNAGWIITIWFVAPRITSSPEGQVIVLCLGILLTGGVQIAVQLFALWRERFLPILSWTAQGRETLRVALTLLPAMLGLAATQINTFVAGYFAWAFSGPSNSSVSATSAAFASAFETPAGEYAVKQGAAAALYYSERLFMFPVGLVGLAVATVVFPVLAQHAASGAVKEIGRDLSWGLRLVIALGLPAGIGLMILAEPIMVLLFQRGEFTAQDAHRTANLIATYGFGVWAFCGLPVVIRAFYALNRHRFPLWAAAGAIGGNIVLNFALVRPLAEVGLVLGSVICGALQLIVLTLVFSVRHSQLDWPALAATSLRAVVASACMAAVGFGLLEILPVDSLMLRWRAASVLLPMLACSLTYVIVFSLLRGKELAILLARK